jgi:hypothetical protein
MANIVVQHQPLSHGPDLHVEKGVHIIFVGPDVQSPGPPATGTELLEIAAAVGTVQKTDVIVFRGLPYHKVGDVVFDHAAAHAADPETILELRVGRDKAVWWSEGSFAIETISPHGLTAGPQPFPVPEARPEPSIDDTPMAVFVARSTVPNSAAKSHEYKISFTHNGVLIDPNMKCT